MSDNAEYISIGEPDLGQIIQKKCKELSQRLNCHRVGKIVAFNSDTFLCTVKLFDKLTYMGQEVDYSELPSLPLVVYGIPNKHLTFGNIVGAECIVHFNDTDMSNWLQTGEVYAPASARRHNFADGFVELSPRSLGKTFTYYASGLELKNGNTVIHLNDDGTVEITNGTSTITMNGNTVAINGNVTISGDITATGTITGDTDVIAGTISGKTHVHTGNLGTDTSTPH